MLNIVGLGQWGLELILGHSQRLKSSDYMSAVLGHMYSHVKQVPVANNKSQTDIIIYINKVKYITYYTLYYIIVCYIMLCYVLLYYIILYYIISYHISD